MHDASNSRWWAGIVSGPRMTIAGLMLVVALAALVAKWHAEPLTESEAVNLARGHFYQIHNINPRMRGNSPWVRSEWDHRRAIWRVGFNVIGGPSMIVDVAPDRRVATGVDDLAFFGF